MEADGNAKSGPQWRAAIVITSAIRAFGVRRLTKVRPPPPHRATFPPPARSPARPPAGPGGPPAPPGGAEGRVPPSAC